jgi:nucleoside-diphosphate-sugar epimerase
MTRFVRSLQKRGAAVYIGTEAGGAPTLRRALEKVDWVIHCAAATRAVNRKTFYAANVAFTKRILSLLGRHQKLILISSQAAVGPSRAGVPVDESVRPAPVNAYGWSKLLAERVTSDWGRENNQNYIVLRPSAVYGPREKDFYLLFKGVRRGAVFLPGDGRQRLSLLHVDDLVRAILMALERAPMGETYFVTGDEPGSWLELVRLIRTALKKERNLNLRCPSALALPAAAVADALSKVTGKPGLICRDKVVELRQDSWLCTNEKIKEQLSWRPVVSLEEGIKQTAAWYQHQGWL